MTNPPAFQVICTPAHSLYPLLSLLAIVIAEAVSYCPCITRPDPSIGVHKPFYKLRGVSVIQYDIIFYLLVKTILQPKVTLHQQWSSLSKAPLAF